MTLPPSILTLSSLSVILRNISGPITIGDIKQAANQFTVPFEKVNDCIQGKGLDALLIEKLIVFFYRKIEMRNG